MKRECRVAFNFFEGGNLHTQLAGMPVESGIRQPVTHNYM